MITYYQCDGDTTVSLNVTMSSSAPKYRTYTVGDTVVTETYKTLTFNCSPAPTSNLRVSYSFQRRINRDYEGFTNWFTTVNAVTILAGHTSVNKDVTIRKTSCASSGGGGYDGLPTIE